jgi:hypothetical protein
MRPCDCGNAMQRFVMVVDRIYFLSFSTILVTVFG